MAKEKTERVKTGRTFDSAYGFSFSIGLGLILFLAGLLVSLTLGGGTNVGLIFGIPLLVAGLLIPIIMMRDVLKTNEIKEPCPNCGEMLRTSDATLQLRCPSCQQVIGVHEGRFFVGE